MDNNNLEQNTMLIDDDLLHNFNSNNTKNINTVGKNNAKKIGSLNRKLFFFNFISIIVSILFAIIFTLARMELHHNVERAIERSFCIPIMWNVVFVVFSFMLKGQNSTTRTARTIQIFSIIGSILTFLLLIYFSFSKLNMHIDYQIFFIFGILFIICYIILFLIIQSEYKNFEIYVPQEHPPKIDMRTQHQIEFEQKRQEIQQHYNAMSMEFQKEYVQAITAERQRIAYYDDFIKKCETSFISHKNFEKNWIINSSIQKGLKYDDYSGCYAILIFDSEIVNGNYSNYKNVYVGQSKRVYSRVHNHFNGKGNGDVYCDVRNGMYVYVKFYKCRETEMNGLEKELIARYHAMQSYNKTHGGS